MQPKPIHIQVVQHLNAGGIETMALDLLRHANHDETLWIVSLEGNLEQALEAWPVLQPYREQLIFLDKKPGWRLSTLYDLWLFLRTHKVASVHSHHIGPLIYGGIAARLAGVPLRIHTEHDAWHLSDHKRRRLQNAILKLVKPRLVADADAVAAELARHWPTLPTETVHNGIDTARFCLGDMTEARKQFALPQYVRLIGNSGRLEDVKGQRFLIDAMAQLSDDIHLAIAGAGSCEQALKQQVADLGLTQRVHFLGRVDDMPSFYQSIDVFCLPSLREGMPLSPLEAQACGAIAVVSDVGGSHEALCPRSGYLTPSGEVDLLAQNLRQAFDCPSPGNPRDFVVAERDLRQTTRAYAAMRQQHIGSGTPDQGMQTKPV